jgi:hypothetical protein
VVIPVIGGLELVARRGEASGQVYPYKWQDWLRYLVPDLWTSHGRPSLMLTGPSTARENFLLEEFAVAFPMFHVAPCAMSLGTFRDVTAGLEYVEREYGPRALPSILVLGISPRFMAEIPAERPFPNALERYARRFGPLVDSGAAFGLSRKPALAGVLDHVRFRLTEQSARYRAALAWVTANMIPPGVSEWVRTSLPVRRLAQTGGGRLSELFAEVGPRGLALRYISPYRYQPALKAWAPGTLKATLDDPDSWWREVFRWDPDRDATAIRARAEALVAWTNQRGIELYVVRLPEHSWLRQRTDPVLAARFDAVVNAAFDPVPVLNLACLLPDEQFLDAEHALLPGARRVSAQVIGYVKAVRQHHAQAGTNGESVKALADQWSRGRCAIDR